MRIGDNDKARGLMYLEQRLLTHQSRRTSMFVDR